MDILTGSTIAKLAFDEFVKSGAGEAAKKAVGGAIEQLRTAIKARFKGKNPKAEEAIAKVEQEGSPEALNKLSVYLDDEMDDVSFAQTLQQIAQQITNIQNTSERQYINHGRDQITIETSQAILESVDHRCRDDMKTKGAIKSQSRPFTEICMSEKRDRGNALLEK